MNIREQYDILLEKEYKFSLINEVNELKEKCILNNNTEFVLKCNILIADIYIEHQNLSEALTLLNKDFNNIDKVVFKNVYLDYIDRLIYLYINKRNYNVAIRYITEKEKNLLPDDIDSLNRLYLEYSYAYGELSKLDKAEEYLFKILGNNPDDNTKSVVLSNLTKIYIDKNDLLKAKEFLNQCLIYSYDHESEVYCDYLLAKICVLEGNSKEALQLYDTIFVNEEINSMTLSMMNDYLKLLNNLKKYDKSLLLMNKLSLFINATNDLYILKSFYQNKLDYFVGTKDNSNAAITMREIEELDNQISLSEKELININFEADKEDLKETTTKEAFNKVELLTTLVNTALKGNSLREIIMDFSNKVKKIIDFDELQFILFNKIDEKEHEVSNVINCLKYKNKRLFEKNVTYDDLKGSVVEMMINNSLPVTLDLHSANFEIKDVFNNSVYDKDENRYLNSIPCSYKDDTFATIIFSSKSIDLTDYSSSMLLKIAAKMLESSLIIQFIEEKNRIIENLNSLIVDENNINVFYIKNQVLYLSEGLKTLLQIKNNSVSIDTLIKKISKADVNKYLDAINSNDKYTIKFKYHLNDKIIELLQVAEPVTDINGKILYYHGTIKSMENESIGYALSEKDLTNRIFELRQKTNLIEFKFSLIKVIGTVDEYQSIKNAFGVEPYYLNDGTFIVILENEANQRTLDKLVKNFVNRSAIIRYPRDIINIDEMLSVAKLMIDTKHLYFTNDVYRGFIKKNNIINKVENSFEKELKLVSLVYNTYDENDLFEIKPSLFGVDVKENIYEYLSGELLENFETKFINSFIPCISEHPCFLSLSNNSIYKVITEYDFDKFTNVSFVMFEYNKLTPVIIDKMKKYNKQIYIDYSLINKFDAYYFTTGVIKGVYVSNSTKIEFNKILRLLNMFNLSLVCYNNQYDYDKLCYYNNLNKLIN